MRNFKYDIDLALQTHGFATIKTQKLNTIVLKINFKNCISNKNTPQVCCQNYRAIFLSSSELCLYCLDESLVLCG